MHDTLRTRIMRRLETLPEPRLYQVLDYIEFLESQYGERAVADVSGLQRIAERIEDGLRKRTFNPSAVREAFQLISAADRVLSSVSDAGRELLADLQAGQGDAFPTDRSGAAAGEAARNPAPPSKDAPEVRRDSRVERPGATNPNPTDSRG